jgi:transposase InsO family protein
MRQIYLQKQFYQLIKHPPVQINEQAKNRLRLLSAWETIRKQGATGETAARAIGISRATLYRWQQRLEKSGVKGLEERSHRPKHERQKCWGMDAMELIKELRELYPRWGKEKLAVLAAREGIKISVSTTGRILHYLKQRGLLPIPANKKWFYSKKRPKRPYATRKPKDYEVLHPGDLVQVDTLDIHPFPKIHLKHFTARDMVSRWDVLEAYPNATSSNAKQFLTTLIGRMPFPVRAIQVDGGSEFMKEFEKACADLGLRLFILPPHSPKLNGRVERAHRTHLDEFYAVYNLDYHPSSLNPVLQEWERIYNHVRPHRSLDNLSPAEYIQAYHPAISPSLSHMY